MTAQMPESITNISKPIPSFNWNRIWIGLPLVLVAIGLIAAGSWAWTLACAWVFWQSFYELNQLFLAKDIHLSRTSVLFTGIGFVALAHWQLKAYFLPLLTLGILLSFFRILTRSPRASVVDMGSTFFAIFYVSFLPMHFILLRELNTPAGLPVLQQPGCFYVLFTCLVIAASDVFAYYAGKAFGREPFYPQISPKKTREGALGGLVGGILIGQLLVLLLRQLTHTHALVLSLLVVIVAQFGDLLESLIKREAGVKDSGTLFQSHGGLLDRVDSYLLSGAVAYYYIYWFVLNEGQFRQLWPLRLL